MNIANSSFFILWIDFVYGYIVDSDTQYGTKLH